MNTRLSLLLPGLAEEEGGRLVRQVRGVLVEHEQVMSRFAPTAELAHVNRVASQRVVAVSEALYGILAECKDHWERTGGAFDITLGAVNDNWRGGKDPVRTGWRFVELDEAQRSVTFHDPSVRLDLGGIGKGVALRAIRGLLVARSVRHAVLSFGESSILTIGGRPDGSEWKLGIGDRFEPPFVIQEFELRDGSLSTSGAEEGKPHLVDPRTGQAVGLNRLLSVLCECAVLAEVLSTALIAAPATKRASILAAYPQVSAAEFSWQRQGGGWRREKCWAHAA